jgi:AcrR family transcriptional regulator
MRILEQAKVELSEQGFDGFSVHRVLEAADVSRGTLYHHFPDVDGLIEAALVATFSQENRVQQALLLELLDRSTDIHSFRDGLREHLRVFSMLPPVIRLRRTHTISLSATRPSLASKITVAQDEITDTWAHVVVEAQRRGFVRGDVEPRSVAVMVQAFGLGRIVDDAANERLDNDRWADILFDVIDRGVLSGWHRD